MNTNDTTPFNIIHFLAAILSLLPITPASQAADTPKPNIVLIVADDLNRHDVGCYGAVNTKTPNLDSLAARGMRMNLAYTAFAQCSPCRAELYSGRFPVSNGLIGNGIPSQADIKSVTHYLKSLGYRTGLAGKQHCGPSEVYDFDNLNQSIGSKERETTSGLSRSELRNKQRQKSGKEKGDEPHDRNEGKDVEDYRPLDFRPLLP